MPTPNSRRLPAPLDIREQLEHEVEDFCMDVLDLIELDRDFSWGENYDCIPARTPSIMHFRDFRIHVPRKERSL